MTRIFGRRPKREIEKGKSDGREAGLYITVLGLGRAPTYDTNVGKKKYIYIIRKKCSEEEEEEEGGGGKRRRRKEEGGRRKRTCLG